MCYISGSGDLAQQLAEAWLQALLLTALTHLNKGSGVFGDRHKQVMVILIAATVIFFFFRHIKKVIAVLVSVNTEANWLA